MKPKPRGRFAFAIASVIAAAAARGLAEFPAAVEWHRTTIFPLVANGLQSIFGRFTSTVGEVLAALVIGVAVISLVRRRGSALVPIAAGAALIVFIFYATWGLGYRYPPLTSRLSPLQETQKSRERLLEVAEGSARLVATLAGGEERRIVPDAEFLAAVNRALTLGYAQLPASIEAAPVQRIAFGPTRFSRVSFAMSRLQISGFYFPWTGEAQINSQMPRTEWPRTAAHERGHQRGFARENEATVAGILACLASDDPFVRYSGALGLFVSFDRDVATADRDARKRIWNLLPKRAITDLQTEFAFWKQFEGAPARVSEKVNDTYLKAQGVTSGVISYSETTNLFLQALETKSLAEGPLKDLR